MSDWKLLVLRIGSRFGFSPQNSEGDCPDRQREPKSDKTVGQGDQEGGCHIDA